VELLAVSLLHRVKVEGARRPLRRGLPQRGLPLPSSGASAGTTWAQQAATRKERRCLAALCEGLDEEWLYPFSRDQVPGVRSGAEAFWRAALSEADQGKQASGQFVRGFLEGAAYWARLNRGTARRRQNALMS
jgi:hypothetical protein